MNLLDKIKLIIEARSFYVEKAFISHSDVLGWNLGYYASNFRGELIEKTREDNMNGMRIIFQDCIGLKIKRLLQYTKDERRFGWIIWYI